MKYVEAIKRDAERTAKRLGIEFESFQAYSSGVYQVGFRERAEESRPIGFCVNDTDAKGAGSNKAGKARSHSAKGAKE